MDDLAQLCDTLREAAFDPKGWAEVQERVERYFGAFSTQIASVDHENGNRFWSRTNRVPEIDAELVDIAPLSEPVRFAAVHPGWQVFCDYDYIDEPGIERSEFYRHNARFEIRYRMIIRLLDTTARSEALVLLWRKKDGHAQRAHFEKLAWVHGQLRLAASVANRIGTDLSSERMLLDVLQNIQNAGLVAGTDGELLLANELARALLSQRDGIAVDAGKIEIGHRPSRPAFRRSLAAAVRGQIAPGETIVSIPRPSGKSPILSVASALPRRHLLFGPARPLVLVLLHDPSDTAPPAAAGLARAFDLTESETSIAQALASGKAPTEIAKRRGTCLGTVRQQIKSIMGKLDVCRQADLLRVLSRLPKQ